MNPKRLVSAVVLALVTRGAGGSAAHDADVLVALGAGVAGSWETEFEFANPDDSNTVAVFAGEQPHPFVCITSPCGIAYASLPRTGTARINTRSDDFGRFTGRLFVGADDAEELPTVKARVVNRARPSQSIELPLFRRSTLVALDPRILSFPGATRSAAAHTNVFVSEIELSSGIDVLAEAFAFSGERLGVLVLALAPGETVFLTDVLARMGVSELSEGQIRLTKTGGGGVMWGLLAAVFDDGRVTVTAGKHP
ncbi:MAG TPA: hypothetical protein VGB47_05820 [Thermoanaerobaculia bacterium]|jgi:hypothetical protein